MTNNMRSSGKRHIYDRFSRMHWYFLHLSVVYSIALIIGCTLCLFPSISDNVLRAIRAGTNAHVFNTVILNVFCSGTLGSAIFGLRRMYAKLTRQVDQNSAELSDKYRIGLWIATFYYKPIVGGTLAIMILAMLNAGFLALSPTTPVTTKETTIQALYFQISFGFLVGFGANELMKKVDEVITFAFRVPKSNDHPAGDGTKPPTNSGM